MKILVLGAGGLAGSAIMRALQAEGHTLSGTCRAPAGHDGSTAIFRLDLSEPQSIVPLLEQVRPDAVVSCLRGDFNCQLEAHGLMADALRRQNGVLVYLSSANVFDGDLSRPHYEGDAPCSDSTYGQFKIACERLLQDRLEQNCVILRPPEIWGRSCPRLHTLLEHTRAGRPIQTYENLSVNYTTDTQLAQWTAFILAHGLRGVFHVGTRDTYDYTAFLDQLAEGLSLPQPVYRVERNDTAAYQAVLPGRREIPEDFQLSVKAALNYLSEGACHKAEKAGPPSFDSGPAFDTHTQPM